MKILLVEDDPFQTEVVRHVLEDDHLVNTACTLDLAKSFLDSEHYDVVLLDLGLPDSVGIDTVRALTHYEIPLVVMTGDDRYETVDGAMKAGARDFLSKSKLTTAKILGAIHGVHTERTRTKKLTDGVKRVMDSLERFTERTKTLAHATDNINT